MVFKSIVGATCVCLAIVSLSVNAGIVTITDNFDDPGTTAALWSTPVGGSWDHPVLNGSDLGYHGVIDPSSKGTGVILSNQQYYDMTNLSMNTLVRLDDIDIAGFALISGSLATGYYDEYAIWFRRYQDPTIDSNIQVSYNTITPSGETNTLMGSVNLPSVTIGTFYSFQLSADSQGNIDIALYDTSDLINPLASLPDVAPTPFTSGMVAIITGNEATFNDFSFTGTVVPIPAAVWLFGSGLLGLIGVARRNARV